MNCSKVFFVLACFLCAAAMISATNRGEQPEFRVNARADEATLTETTAADFTTEAETAPTEAATTGTNWDNSGTEPDTTKAEEQTTANAETAAPVTSELTSDSAATDLSTTAGATNSQTTHGATATENTAAVTGTSQSAGSSAASDTTAAVTRTSQSAGSSAASDTTASVTASATSQSAGSSAASGTTASVTASATSQSAGSSAASDTTASVTATSQSAGSSAASDTTAAVTGTSQSAGSSATSGTSGTSAAVTGISTALESSSVASTAVSSGSSGSVTNAATTAAPTVITVLEVTTALDVLGIEQQMQTQFESLFIAFCRNNVYSAQCKPFLSATFRRSSRAVYADCYDVNIPFNTGGAVANGKTLYVAVGFLCGEIEMLFIPSSLLVPFFTQNNNDFTGISITSAYSSVSVTSAAVTSPRADGKNDAYEIATICLAVLSGLLLLGLVGYVAYVESQKKKRVAAASKVADLPVSAGSTYPMKSGKTDHSRAHENDYDSADL